MGGCWRDGGKCPKRFESLDIFSRNGFLLWSAIVLSASLAGGVAGADECRPRASARASVVAIGPRGELTLADHRIVRLAGFDPAQATPTSPGLGETVRAALDAKLAGKTVDLDLMMQKPDRWGRLAADVWISDGQPAPGGVAAEALALGLGRYLAEPSAHACRDSLIRAEAAARRTKLGLWADPYYGVLAVDDRAGFAERTGTIVLTEGTVAEVLPGPFRTTLRFDSTVPKSVSASRGVHMLVVTILPGVMKTFRARQFDVSRLVGRRIRVRGLLDMRFGPRIGLNDPDEIEMLGPSVDRPQQ